MQQRGAERSHRIIRLIKPRMRVSHIDTVRFCRYPLNKGRVLSCLSYARTSAYGLRPTETLLFIYVFQYALSQLS